MKRKALGKGLAALLPEVPPTTSRPARPDSVAQAVDEGWAEVDLERIDPNPHQPRQHVGEEKIQELAQSLRKQGVMQPLVVRRVGARYQIVAGERRWRAARVAGLERVPVVVRNVKDEELLELALIENIQREDLNPMEEAGAYKRLVSELGLSQEQVAERVGKDRSTVANLLRLLRLPAPIRLAIAQQKVSAGHARPLLTLRDSESQLKIAREVEERGLSVREVERRVKALTREPKPSPGADPQDKPRQDANTRAAEDRLRAALGTKVRIVRAGRSGTVEIAFYTEEDLNRIYEILLRGSRDPVTRIS